MGTIMETKHNERPAREFNDYKPFTSNYKQVHKELLVIDGTTNLIALNKDSKFIDWYLKGGASAVVCTVSTAGMTASSNQKAQDQTLDILGYRQEKSTWAQQAHVRTAAPH